MHTIFGIRGIKEYADKFINELSTRYLAFKIYNPKTKKLENTMLQMRVCPIQFYDVSFPKEHADAVFNTIYGAGKGEPMNLKFRKYIKILRKLFGLKPLPEYKRENHLWMSFPEHTEVVCLGIKEDFWITEKGEHVDEEHKTDLSYEGI